MKNSISFFHKYAYIDSAMLSTYFNSKTKLVFKITVNIIIGLDAFVKIKKGKLLFLCGSALIL